MSKLTTAGRYLVLPVLLMAVLLQANAVVRSLVMQAAPTAMDPACAAAMPGMAMGGHGAAGDHSAPKHAACPFCAAAAHVPVFCATPPLPRSHQVAFLAFDPFVVSATRDPLTIRARARDPPTFRLT